ncbi:MAG: hypothetical protein E6Q43_01135 [Dokdonella sp.]|nr:MAG: hypothetical protein E6Q43_01135 [Dokdonella sp.]
MPALLSFQQTPPLAAPIRFFLTAPVFAIFGGLLLAWSGPSAMLSRWTPSALALTHLITAGVMLQVMLGAMFQILPVVAGAGIAQPLRLARWIHFTLTLGALVLAAAFLTYQPGAFEMAVGLLGAGVVAFVLAASRALYGLPSTTPTIRGLKLALVGLGVTVTLGALLALALGGSYTLPLRPLTAVHLAWGLLGWGLVLLAAVALVVVPMFQMTPAYPEWFARHFGWSVLLLLIVWGAAELAAGSLAATVLAGALVLVTATFPVLTLYLQHRSRRARFDATQHYWRIAMLSFLLAAAFGVTGNVLPTLAEWPQGPWLCGVLVLVGGFMSVMNGMLYKIVPFLVWLHLQNLGGGRVIAPTMTKVLAVRQIGGQLYTHLASLILLLTATIWPEALLRPAAIVFLLANAWLLRNLLAAMHFYSRHRARIAALPATSDN